MRGKATDGKLVRFTADHIYVNWNKNAAREKGYVEWLGEMFRQRLENRG